MMRQLTEDTKGTSMCRSKSDPDGPKQCAGHCRPGFAATTHEEAALDAEIAAVEAQLVALQSGEGPTPDDLEQAGYSAAAEGKMAAPALSPLVQQAIQGRDVGDPATMEAMRAYQRGYQRHVDDATAALMASFAESAPHAQSISTNTSLMEKVSTLDVADARTSLLAYGRAQLAANHRASITEYRARDAESAQMLAATRGPLSGRPEAAEMISDAYRDAARYSAAGEGSAWDSPAVVEARRAYGPGTATDAAGLSGAVSGEASDRDLRHRENVLFYEYERRSARGDADGATRVKDQLVVIRLEMESRGIGPKAL